MFDPNDLKNSLFYSGNYRSGSYNQLQWIVHPGDDYTNLISRIISVHEFLHNDLNNITGFGFLLQGFAYLSREDTDQKERYGDILHSLVQSCTLAHEAYATWISINIFKAHHQELLEKKILDKNKEYQRYYHFADRLVRNVKSIFLRQQVVGASIRFCFQSRKIAEYGIRNLFSFDIDAVSPSEFPDKRFLYLINHLPDTLFSDIIARYILNMDDGREKEFLREAFNGNEPVSELIDPGNDDLAETVSAQIYFALQEHFNHLGSPSLENKEEHLTYFKHMLRELDLICPFDKSRNPLFLNNAPDDSDRSVLINFENETVMLSQKPLSCIILQPNHITDKTRTEILNGFGEEPHLFIMGRYRPFLHNQYIFMHKEDEEWFMNSSEFFTFIRYAGELDGERVVVMIPFDEPAKLVQFLDQRKTGLPVLGCIATSTSFNDTWWETWGDFFNQHCTFCCLLADISPLYYIEKVFPGAESVTYTYITLKAPAVTYTGMLFQAKNGTELKMTMLAPGSYVYCQALDYYIKTRYAAYVNEDFTKGMQNYLPIIFSHVVREEHTWYYRSQNINL
jgi:hypothetical protein